MTREREAAPVKTNEEESDASELRDRKRKGKRTHLVQILEGVPYSLRIDAHSSLNPITTKIYSASLNNLTRAGRLTCPTSLAAAESNESVFEKMVETSAALEIVASSKTFSQ